MTRKKPQVFLMLRTPVAFAIIAGMAGWCALAQLACADNPLIEAGLTDPGYANAAERVSIAGETFRPGVYLGNQWFLTTAHGGDPTFVQLNGERFDVIPGRTEFLNNDGIRALNIEADNDIEMFNPGFQAVTQRADLQLFRIGLNADGETPEQANAAVRTLNNPDADRRLVIADSSPNTGADVIAIGIQSSSSLNTNENFGTNRVSNVDVDNNNDGLNIFFSLAGDVSLQVTRNDAPNAFGSTPFEFQSQGGDSGTPVFVENAQGEFEFGGVLHVVFPNSDGAIDEIGSLTGFTDIGNPIADYRGQILEIFDDNQYSIDGDVNLDGVVTEDDLLALASGWNADITDANIGTWVQGDLNQDGDTNLSDFALLRAALGGTITISQLNSAIASAGIVAVVVPEPHSAALLVLATGGLAGLRRRR